MSDAVVERRLPAGPGLHLSVRERAGGSPELFCLHGLASNSRWWDPVGEMLAPRQRVVAVDLRGHGRSDRPESGFDFPEVVGDLEALWPALGFRDPVVVGHSWGASVALWLAAERSDVRGVVCVDGGAADLALVFGGSWPEAEARMRPPDLVGIAPERLRQFVAGSGLADEVGADEAFRILEGNFEPAEGGGLRPRLDVRRHMEIARALYNLDQPTLLSRVSCPVLFVMAESSPVPAEEKRRSVERASSALSGAARAVFISGGHDLPVQRPAEVAAAIRDFTAELAGG